MIDFDNLPVLIGPRRKRLLEELYDREKLARAHMRRAKGPKNHSTNRERSQRARRKAATARRMAVEADKELAEYKALVRAYWCGDLDEHP